MTLSRLPDDAAKPRPPDGFGAGAVLAVLVHLLLLAALAFGVNWRAHEPEAVSAELWSAVPQQAAPRAVSPPPPPPAPVEAKRPAPPVPKVAPEPPRVADAQIAIEKARRDDAKRQTERDEQRRQEQKREAKEELLRQEAQRQKAQREKIATEEAHREQLAQQAEARRKQELAEKARKDEATLVAQREANLKRIQGQANATGDAESTGSAARSSGPSASYAGRIKARIKPNIVFTDSVSGNPLATVEVRCASDGTIVSRKLVKGSGNALWDDAVLRAIDKTETLPRDVDGRVPPLMQIDFKPRD
ncbi:MAG: cell envelope integrity protein TolA [Caldimonas sp.]